MSSLAALLVGLAAALLVPVPPRDRLAPPQPTAAGAPPTSPTRAAAKSGVASVALGMTLWAFVGGWLGAVVGATAAAVLFRVVSSLDDTDTRAQDDVLAAQAADMADMLGACVASGASLERATAQVAAALHAPARDLLAGAAAQQALGAHAAAAWAELRNHEATAPVARAIVRSLDSGAPLADALTSCATELRDIRRARIEVMAQAVAVKAVGPLGLCFLPAFLLIGVVPLVAGLVSESIDLF